MIDIVVPEEQEGTKAVLKNWLKKPGDEVRINDPLVEIETDKVAVEIAAIANGVLAEILVEPETDIEPGQVLGRISDNVELVPLTEKAQAKSVATAQTTHRTAQADQLPPGIRRLLSEHNLQPDDVPVRGAKLTREDIEAEVARRAIAPTTGGSRIPHDSMRRRIAEHMAQSVRIAPHVTALFEVDFSAIIAHRDANKAAFAADDMHLTFTAYFVAAIVDAMKVMPLVNSRWRDDCIETFEDINVGVGTALGDKGLIVPVIHRAQTLSLKDIAKRLTALTDKARAGKLAPSDVQNGTFSISNHGVSGSLLAAPIIINQPQSAILGVGKLQKRAMVRESEGRDAVEIRPMAYVTLTIDHRVLDAYQCNAWLTRFVETLENWK